MDTMKTTNSIEEKRQRPALDPGNLMLLIYTLVIGLIILVGGLLPAGAEESLPVTGEYNPENPRQGELLLAAADGKALTAVQLAQDVHITISGIAARVQVSQEFVNSADGWTEGVYVFPLPDESAVDTLKMVIGEREIVGEIREREEARAIYEQARAEGKKSSLLAQNRPNIFTTRVANIGPGEKVRIVIEYQQLVSITDTTFSLRFPLAITPRYIPGRKLPAARQQVHFGGEGWGSATDLVPDGGEITPPVAFPQSAQGPRVSLSVDLQSGFPLARLESLYHQMIIDKQSEEHHLLSFTGTVLADRDFLLEWQPAAGRQPTAALLTEEKGDERYLLLMLQGPAARPEGHVPREMVYILDVSGSMAGPSIVQAKAALRQGLQKLTPADTFNVIVFNNSAQAFFPSPRPATGENVLEALDQLEMLKADGGTEMRSALEMALVGAERSARIRQLLFLTDGAVGNEDELLQLISSRLGDSRLFTVGIGSAPNSYFMTRAATIGRGTFSFIGKVEEVQSRMAALLTMLEAPVLTDIRIGAADGRELSLVAYPDPIPDLYYGEPLMVALRSSGTIGDLVVSGRQLEQVWQYRVDLSGQASRPGIARLWARKKIREHMESLALGADETSVRKMVLETALAHQLVSRYTSLVAVDPAPSRPAGENLGKAVIKGAPPAGLQLEAVFGGGAQTATPAALQLLMGSGVLILAGMLAMARRRLW